MPDGKRCGESLGLEKLAVGRNGLLPYRGTANSPFTPMVWYTGPLCLMANDVGSPWAWSRPFVLFSPHYITIFFLNYVVHNIHYGGIQPYSFGKRYPYGISRNQAGSVLAVG